MSGGAGGSVHWLGELHHPFHARSIVLLDGGPYALGKMLDSAFVSGTIAADSTTSS
ncbi:hypothetical protein [Arthrobacter psychrolactophilus]|uniref:hypothetical protein n=1 Tax=Arthrobacter psychrolactophilus TaxID=92442 RepID=UPI0015E8B0A4|nr:hypothetical protein [Arthrobacter psychrolactophilus]